MRNKKITIGLGYNDISGNLVGIAEGLLKTGAAEPVFFTLEPSKYITTNAHIDSISKAHSNFLGLLNSINPGITRKSLKFLAWHALTPLRLLILLRILLKCDCIIVLAGNYILPFRLDYLAYRLTGITFVCSFHGTDCRPPYISGKFANRKKATNRIKKEVPRKKRRLRAAEYCADYVVNTPPQAVFSERPFISQFCIGKPVQERIFLFRKYKTTQKNNKLRVLHAPSHHLSKGSELVREAVQNVKKSGVKFDYIEVTGVTHDAILYEIAKADILIDQAYSDTPLPSTSKEALAIGTPTIVGSYYAPYAELDIPANKMPPTVLCPPDDIEKNLEMLLLSPEVRANLSRKSLDYAIAELAPEKVAGYYLSLARKDGVPDSFYYDANTLNYMLGCGVNKKRARAVINDLIAQYGMKSLGLSKKPRQLKALLIQTDLNCSLNQR